MGHKFFIHKENTPREYRSINHCGHDNHFGNMFSLFPMKKFASAKTSSSIPKPQV